MENNEAVINGKLQFHNLCVVSTCMFVLYIGLLAHSGQLLEGYKHLVQAYDGKLILVSTWVYIDISLLTDMFQIFSAIGVHERQQSASLAFSNFGTAHR